MKNSSVMVATWIVYALMVLLASPTFSEETPSAASEKPYYETTNVDIPMRDGVVLRADIRRPAAEGKYPVLIFRTPYDKEEGDPDNEKTFNAAVQRGYAVVIQDVRGRFASDGEFVPYENEGRDGYDTIEWAAVQPWSTGEIGTFGLSYPGAVQWLAAVENPPHLKAMVPAMCFSTLRECIYFGGVFESAWVSWIYKYITPDIRVKKDLTGPKTIEEATVEWGRLGGTDYMQGSCPSLLMPHLRDAAPFYYDWLEHSPYDPWWNWGDVNRKYDQVQAAVLNLSGWYDEPYGTQGAIANYLGLLQNRVGADPRTRLLIGPWIHGVDATGAACAGNRVFSESARLDYHSVVLDWLDYYVRGISNSVPCWPNVMVYLMGREEWLKSDVWPLPEISGQPLYFGDHGALVPSIPEEDGFSAFVSDPANPVRDELDTNFGAYDLRSLSDRPDVLTVEMPPVENDLDVVGHILAEIYVSSDEAPDFDIYAKLLDVAPDGTAFNLESAGHEVIRVSYRNKTADRQLLSPNEVVKLSFDNLLTANTLKPGHRLRVCLMASWFPTYSRNPQNGELETTSGNCRKATIRIHHGPQYPSRLVLPVHRAEQH